MRPVLFSAIVLLPSIASAQFPFNLGGTSLDQGFAVAATPAWEWHQSFIVVTGEFRESVDFDPGVDEHVLVANGTRDAFVASYSEAGTLRWAFNLGGPGVDGGNGVAIDQDGNVYVVGTFRQTVDFDPGAGEHLITSNGETDAFLASYTSDGDFRWAFNLGGAHFDQGHAVTVTDFGAICATGSFRETVDFDPGQGETTFTSAGSFNIWMACYTRAAGELVWAYGTGGPGNFDRGWAIAAHEDAVYVTGDFTGSVQFDPAGDAEPLTALGLNDLFVASYAADGTYRWAHRAGSSSNEIGNRGNGIAAAYFFDGGDLVYVTGDIVGTADFPGGQELVSAGGRDAFVATFTTDGEPLAAFAIGGPGDERGTGIALVGEMPSFRYAAVTGYFEETVDLSPTGGHPVTSPGGRSFFVATYSQIGQNVWLEEGFAVGGSLNDQSYGIAGSDVLYVTGSFRGTVDFHTGVLTTNGPLDAFVARYSVAIPPTPSTEPTVSGMNAPRIELVGGNPFTRGTAVSITSNRAERLTVEVVDLLGRVVATPFDGFVMAGAEQTAAIPELPGGVYVVRVRGAMGASAIRVTSVGR